MSWVTARASCAGTSASRCTRWPSCSSSPPFAGTTASVGTRFPARDATPSAYKLWLRHALPTTGRIEVDPGARRALEQGGASLLPVGIRSVGGRFAAGDGVELVDGDGVVFARGIAEMGHAEVRRLAGTRGADPAVHRDRLALL